MIKMMRKPLIGCTTYHKTSDQNPPIDIYGLMPAYLKAIVAAGGVPVMIPLGLSESDLQEIIQQMDGILLPGGGDIEPSVYQGQGNAKVYGVDTDRDRVEFVVARTAVAQQKPLLAICRGVQVLNVALGGSLWEDVELLMPGAMHHEHLNSHPRSHLAHTVTIEPDSLLAQQLGRTETAVNSLHHQGIRRLAEDLRATAVAPDGLIEGVEVIDHPYAVGVQWHPENLIHNAPHMLGLFRGLVEAAFEPVVSYS
ncbi:MAG: gamma-glutamyl-gamma-aminobutyrate hydrolase family protein [Ardenticatenaceae bacterium]|nr:gamma-glutamyl-gamma-aminobutyrate hydrolase family protein [Anaerolineales bacterium]MCB8938688.1 gamma-glutamyl-gamma-aminobutyrate hydrolase family protein [Ardenticatenaceae bacterium]MCB8973924.1 gamma-glutamyl-gamma-aminobutyrate hydrolase family protein [Ardenticatenaceae bacterium]